VEGNTWRRISTSCAGAPVTAEMRRWKKAVCGSSVG
jgi:hypothetical protein